MMPTTDVGHGPLGTENQKPAADHTDYIDVR